MTKVNKTENRVSDFSPTRFLAFLSKIQQEVDYELPEFEAFCEKLLQNIQSKTEITSQYITSSAILSALEKVPDIKDESGNVQIENLRNINWRFFAARVFLENLYKSASRNRFYAPEKKYGDYPSLVRSLVEKRLYHSDILVNYSDSDLEEIGKLIEPEKDLLFDYAGIRSLSERYLVREKTGEILELPQERFLTAAVWLMQNENQENRLEKIKELYWAQSNLFLTLATPTLSNAGKVQNTLTSCHIVDIDDSLESIYDSDKTVANFSKSGAGLGVNFSRLRSTGSDIKGFKGRANSFIYWFKKFDTTFVAVDQLGVRTGSGAAWLIAWHKDIFQFLDLRLNTGDQDKRTHNLSLGLVLPDLFWRQVQKRGEWHLFDPHEIKETMGFDLNEAFDRKKLGDDEEINLSEHEFSFKYNLCVKSNVLSRTTVNAIELAKAVMKSQVETGYPYHFNKDTANRAQTNSHTGMIQVSNLCTEIIQVTKPTTYLEKFINETGEIFTKKHSGYMVSCNLSSLVVNRIWKTENPLKTLKRVINIQVRALDNVIDVGSITVPEASYTNSQFRNIGAGEMGIAALLARQGLKWSDSKALKFVEKLEENILYYTISASADLAQERGSYPLFPGSDWDTGLFFEKNKLESVAWTNLKNRVRLTGIRNGQLRSPAPNGSTAIIAGSTPGIDPIFDVIYFEKKKDMLVPVVVPDLDETTWFYYQPTYRMKPYDGEDDLKAMWSVLLNEIRQKHVDQASSFNLYVPDTISGKNLLRLHQEIWNRGIKTSYYVRSHNQEREESCFACSG